MQARPWSPTQCRLFWLLLLEDVISVQGWRLLQACSIQLQHTCIQPLLTWRLHHTGLLHTKPPCFVSVSKCLHWAKIMAALRICKQREGRAAVWCTDVPASAAPTTHHPKQLGSNSEEVMLGKFSFTWCVDSGMMHEQDIGEYLTPSQLIASHYLRPFKRAQSPLGTIRAAVLACAIRSAPKTCLLKATHLARCEADRGQIDMAVASQARVAS